MQYVITFWQQEYSFYHRNLLYTKWREKINYSLPISLHNYVAAYNMSEAWMKIGRETGNRIEDQKCYILQI